MFRRRPVSFLADNLESRCLGCVGQAFQGEYMYVDT